MTIAEALREATARLSQTSDTARLDAELLMARALKVTRSDMLLRHQSDPPPLGFEAMIERRIKREPVAYIIGCCEFYGRQFIVNQDVLIPRSDSETLVEAALVCGPDVGRAIDLGTGSGALLITVLSERAGLTGLGIDASANALGVARKNAQALGVGGRVDFQMRDWTDHKWSEDLGAFDLILCNPPYVEDDAELDPDVRAFEPSSALFAGPDGLDDYRILIPQMRKILSEGGVAVFEIGAKQAESVTRIAEHAGFVVEIRQDLANRPRAVVLR